MFGRIADIRTASQNGVTAAAVLQAGGLGSAVDPYRHTADDLAALFCEHPADQACHLVSVIAAAAGSYHGDRGSSGIRKMAAVKKPVGAVGKIPQGRRKVRMTAAHK